MGRVDLHTHSWCSDGTCSPAELVRRAREKGVEALALTDHDTVSGWTEARREARRLGVRLACGIELNTREGDQVHVLGYGIDPRSAPLTRSLALFRRRRRERLARIIGRLRALDVEIEVDDFPAETRCSIGRPHVADALCRKGIVRDRKEAFRRFLRKGGPAYVPSMGPAMDEAIEAVRAAGGWACLAHPGMIARSFDVGPWVDIGLEGLEVYYPGHSRAQTSRLLETAERYGLAVTGGSDYHGPESGHEEIGETELPEDAFRRIEDRLGFDGAGDPKETS